MPRKKQAESAKSRRQKLLDYFHSHARQARFISDVKNDLNIKNEQNLRRDLELLAEAGMLEKSKDTSKLPARAVFTLKDDAPKVVNGMPDDAEDGVESAAPKAEAKAAKAPKAPKAAAAPKAEAPASSNGAGADEVKGRRSARELEQQILSLLEQQPTTVKDLAEHLERQQPTVTKALERMQERRLVERKRQGRSFVYSRLSKSVAAAPAAPAAPAAAPKVAEAAPKAAAAAPAAPVAAPTATPSVEVATLSMDHVRSIIDAAVQAGVRAALDQIQAAAKR